MKRPATLLAVGLLLISALVIGYRIIGLGYPVIPIAGGASWELSMNAFAEKTGQRMHIEIGLPRHLPGQIIVNEVFLSGALQFGILYDPPNRAAVWSEEEKTDREIIGYRATLLRRGRERPREEPPVLGQFPQGVTLEEQVLARRLVAKFSELEPKGRLRAVAATVSEHWGNPAPDEADLRAWDVLNGRLGPVTALVVLLRAVNLPARPAEGLLMVESARVSPIQWVEGWTGEQWESVHPQTGEIYPAGARLLPLAIGDRPAVRVADARLTDIRWALRRSFVNRWDAHFERISRSRGWLDQWSLFHLPLAYQQTFRIILLVPIGALLVSVLRNVIGFATFGTFMPVLMALAFRNTGLVYGLGIFLFIIGLGYVLRRAVDPLRLLLVPRLSFLLTLVIACLTTLALVGNQVGAQGFMAVGLLPIVILTMVIERFFIIVEEAGAVQGFQTAAGSAVVAVIIYGLIQSDSLQLTFFVFPELMFTVAAGQVALGRYTGFRLSELLRFREFRRSP